MSIKTLNLIQDTKEDAVKASQKWGDRICSHQPNSSGEARPLAEGQTCGKGLFQVCLISLSPPPETLVRAPFLF